MPNGVPRLRSRVGSTVLVGLVVLLGFGLAACQNIPEDASKAAFCGAGEKFSALDKVAFSQGKDAIDRLAKVGTPADIDDAARSGFVELIDRMNASDSAADFRSRTRSMDAAERDHLFALDSYIQGTCSDRVPLAASRTDFCAATKAFAAVKDSSFELAMKAVDELAKIGTPDDINASARLGFIEVMDRMNASLNAADFATRTKAMNEVERSHLAALTGYIKKTCG